MKIKHLLVTIGLLSTCTISAAANLSVFNATVTKVQTYATSDDTATFLIHLNGNQRVGPNPNNSSNTCELWSRDKQIYSAALAALMSGKKVEVTYEDQGGGGAFCNAVVFSVLNN